MIASKTKKKIASQTNGLTSNFSAVQKNSVLRKFLQKKIRKFDLENFSFTPHAVEIRNLRNFSRKLVITIFVEIIF